MTWRPAHGAPSSPRSRIFGFGLLLWCSACGRIGFDQQGAADAQPLDAAPLDARPMDATARDSASVGDALVDAPPDADASLPPRGVFRVEELSIVGASDGDATLRIDELEVYLSSDRGGEFELWRATRMRATDPWSAPARVPELNGAGKEHNPQLSRDGLELFFTEVVSLVAVVRTTRSSFTTPWAIPTLIGAIDAGRSEACPAPSADGLSLVYCSNEGSAMDLFITMRPAPGRPFSVGARITELSSTSTDVMPYFGLPGGLVLFFASDRTGGARDLYQTSRPDLATPFLAPTTMTEVNTTAAEEDPWMSDDGRRFYFTSDRSGDSDIYILSR